MCFGKTDPSRVKVQFAVWTGKPSSNQSWVDLGTWSEITTRASRNLPVEVCVCYTKDFPKSFGYTVNLCLWPMARWQRRNQPLARKLQLYRIPRQTLTFSGTKQSKVAKNLSLHSSKGAVTAMLLRTLPSDNAVIARRSFIRGKLDSNLNAIFWRCGSTESIVRLRSVDTIYSKLPTHLGKTDVCIKFDSVDIARMKQPVHWWA